MIYVSGMVGRFARAMVRVFRRIARGQDPYVPDEIQEQRINVCKVCPFYLESDDQCRLCGCCVSFKALFRDERCPANPPHWIDIT